MIFGLQANYKVMSRDEREERDYMHMQRQGRRDRCVNVCVRACVCVCVRACAHQIWCGSHVHS